MQNNISDINTHYILKRIYILYINVHAMYKCIASSVFKC